MTAGRTIPGLGIQHRITEGVGYIVQRMHCSPDRGRNVTVSFSLNCGLNGTAQLLLPQFPCVDSLVPALPAKVNLSSLKLLSLEYLSQ